MLLFGEPKSRKTHYHCRVKNDLNFTLFDANVKNILRTKTGYRLSVTLQQSETGFVDNLDEKVLEYVKENNRTWFDNELSEEEIDDMYNKSYCSQNQTIDVDIVEHTVLQMNDSEIEIEEIKDKIFDENTVVNIKIKYIGLNIYKDCVRNKWIVSNIDMNYAEDLIIDNKDSIEEFWQNTVNESIDILDVQMSRLAKKKEILQKLISDLKKCETQDKIWDKKISEIKGFVQNIIFQR
jgi:hypothetical protein